MHERVCGCGASSKKQRQVHFRGKHISEKTHLWFLTWHNKRDQKASVPYSVGRLKKGSKKHACFQVYMETPLQRFKTKRNVSILESNQSLGPFY